jgi:hypothetical protein
MLLQQIGERFLGKLVERPLCCPRQGFEGVPRLRGEVDASRHTKAIPRLCEDAESTGSSQNDAAG